MVSSARVQVTHEAEAARFVARIGGAVARCDYRRHGGTLDLHHTEVPPALEGRGIAAALVAAALHWARGQGLRVRPTCTYVAAYMRRHHETQDLLA